MKYLFLDLEWNQKGEKEKFREREVLSIGGVWAEEEKKKERSFFRVVKPKNIEEVSESTLSLLHIGRNVLEEAHGIEDVMQKFAQTFPKFDVLVVWSINTLNVFKKTVSETKVKLCEYNTIILQDLIKNLDSKTEKLSNFENTLVKYQASFKKNLLHIAKYDAEYLKNLFYIVKAKLEKIEEYKEENFVRIGISKKIHDKDCHYIVKKDKSKIVSARIIDVFSGYTLCHYCLQKKKFQCIPHNVEVKRKEKRKIWKFSEKSIEQICKNFQMDCRFSEGVIFVNTKLARWRIYHNEEKVLSIYHENYRQNRSEAFKKRKKCNEGFHQQQVKIEDFYLALQYIYNHDKNFLKEKSTKKSRIDELFKLIETQEREKQRLKVPCYMEGKE